MAERRQGQGNGAREEARGRRAARPREIPARGWRDVLGRVKRSVAHDNVSLISAGVALFALLGAFPMLAAFVLIYGLVSSPADIQQHMQIFTDVLPADASRLIGEQLEDLATRDRQALGLGLALTFLISLWSSRRVMTGLMAATNVAYGERETRGFLRQVMVSLGLTLGFILGLLLMVAVALVVPIVLRVVPLGPIANAVILGLRWVLLALFMTVGLAILYRYAPDRRRAAWRWITPGSVLAIVLWLAASLLFGIYVRNFGNFNETYGALGGAILLILWFYLTAFVIVLGAELNAEMEHQTARDTTRGGRQPLGERGARVADELGPIPE